MACAASLAACGQKGPLYLPSEPAASGRATLPQVLGISAQTAPDAAGTAAPSPAAATAPVRPPQNSTSDAQQQQRAE